METNTELASIAQNLDYDTKKLLNQLLLQLATTHEVYYTNPHGVLFRIKKNALQYVSISYYYKYIPLMRVFGCVYSYILQCAFDISRNPPKAFILLFDRKEPDDDRLMGIKEEMEKDGAHETNM